MIKDKTIVLNYALLAIIFAAAALVVVLYAAGYQVDLTSREISSTGLIVVQADPSDAEVYLNNELKGSGKVVLRGLKADKYDIAVKKDGYHEWSKSINLRPGEAAVLNDAILFKEGIKKEGSNFEQEFSELEKFSDRDNLAAVGGEIRQNGVLVTRLSTDIFGLCWYTDRRYIAFSGEGKLKIIHTDGSHLVDLLEKDSATAVIFVNGGRSVIYEDGGNIWRAEIR